MNVYDETQLDAIAAELNAAGTEWEALAATMPHVYRYEPAGEFVSNVIELDGPSLNNHKFGHTEPRAILVMIEYPEQTFEDPDLGTIAYPASAVWRPLGWSDAARSRLGRMVTDDGVEMLNPRDGAAVRFN